MTGVRRDLLVGIDTGGTFTDAVLYDDSTSSVVATAKAPTTHDDLGVGMAAALDRVIEAAGADPGRIRLVCLSTTLATNALVEAAGRPAGLVAIGFDDATLGRAGLRAALGDDPLIEVAGGHGSHGDELEPLDVVGLRAAVIDAAPACDAFAVAAQFSVRNPAHELAARDLIREATGLPVSCSHELSDGLNGPKRAVTALLNARLIPLIDELVTTTAETLARRGIDARLMVMRGDGSLVSTGLVAERPIETILSGPAASVVGAAHLTGVDDAVLVDIGGTTTDIAIVRDGIPASSPQGAVVGGHRTMIDALDMVTVGLGGDSLVRVAPDAIGAHLEVGPRRAVPLARLATRDGPTRDVVERALRRQLASSTSRSHDGVFVEIAGRHRSQPALGPHEEAILATVASASTVVPADTLVESSVDDRALTRLVRRGLVRLAAFTPTDAAHVLGLQDDLDTEIAALGAELFARRPDRFGNAIAADAASVARSVRDAVVQASADALLGRAFAADDLEPSLATSELVRAALDGTLATVAAGIGLQLPVVAVGAPAPSYYPDVVERLDAALIIPDHADVANAVGAAVGSVRISRSVVITAPRRGTFRVHLDAPENLHDLEAAKARATEHLAGRLDDLMARAGAPDHVLRSEWHEKSATVDDRALFVEGTVTVIATGRPR